MFQSEAAKLGSTCILPMAIKSILIKLVQDASDDEAETICQFHISLVLVIIKDPKIFKWFKLSKPI